MNRTIAATSVIVVLTLTGAAGCSAVGIGGSTTAGTRSPTAHSSSPSAAVYHQAAQCIRAHGAPNFPDPIRNPQTGEWDVPDGTPKPPQSAMNACRSILSKIPETRGGGPEEKPLTAAEMAKAKQWATCMRQHGLADFPSDPDANGTFTLPQRYAQLGKTGMRTQLEACHKPGVDGVHMTIEGNG